MRAIASRGRTSNERYVELRLRPDLPADRCDAGLDDDRDVHLRRGRQSSELAGRLAVHLQLVERADGQAGRHVRIRQQRQPDDQDRWVRAEQYTWDFENRLTRVTLPGGSQVNFKYDPFGRRIQKTSSSGTTNYVYDGANVLEEVDTAGNLVTRYTQNLGIDEPLALLRSGTTSYYEADGLGTITSLTNSSGAIANTYTYDSFGKLTASSGTVVNPYRFTAREFDSRFAYVAGESRRSGRTND